MDSHSYYHEYEQNDRRWSDSSRSGRYSYSYDSAGSEAVDFSLFEGKDISGEKKSKPRQEEKQTGFVEFVVGALRGLETLKVKSESNAKNKSRATTVAILMIIVIGVGVLLNCQMQHYELLQEISTANATLSELQQDYVDLSVTYESKMSNSAIEEYATTVLGMQKRDDDHTEYVTLGGGDVFESTTNDGIFEWLEDKFDELLSYMD